MIKVKRVYEPTAMDYGPAAYGKVTGQRVKRGKHTCGLGYSLKH
jgi:hypothetical protein